MLGDWLGLRTALLTVFVTLGFILSVSWWARPLVRNATLSIVEVIKSKSGIASAAPPKT
jgi:hypothetical protein